MLTAEERTHWAEESEEGGSINHAVAKHLAGCERLLAHLRTRLTNLEYRANKNAAVTIRLDRLIASEWKTRIDAVLGPSAATS